MSTPQDVQAKLDAAVANLNLALSDIAAARLEVGGLITKQLTAAFKETSVSLTVNFTDQSNPGPSGPITAWHWDFGDGGTSTSQNPSHVYSTANTYTVALTVTGSGSDGTNLISLPVTVVNPAAIKASFTETDVGLAATFTDTSTPGPSGPITGWAWNFGDGNTSTSQNPVHTYAAAGTYSATLTVTGTSPDGTSSVTNPVTVISGGLSFISVTNAARPAFTIPAIGSAHDKPFTTKTGLDAAIAGMTGGDYIHYTGSGALTISSNTGAAYYALKNKNPASTVVIDLGCSHNIWDPSKVTNNYVAFRYTGTSSFPSFTFNNISNIRIYGGDYSSGATGGSGFGGAIGNTHDCYFWDMYIHDCGTGGMGFIPKDSGNGVNTTIDSINVRGEVYNWGLDPSKDSHVKAPGTGLHACLIADAGGGVTNSTFAVWGHTSNNCGCTFEMGSQVIKGSGLIAHNTIYAKGEHEHLHSTQTASNTVNLWGDKNLATNVFGWIEGNDLYGCVMHSAMSASASTGLVVNHGRHSSTNLNPSDGITVPYMTGKGIVYNDCT